jgi:hypothetical protein
MKDACQYRLIIFILGRTRRSAPTSASTCGEMEKFFFIEYFRRIGYNIPMSLKRYKVFLASSAELSQERKEIALMISDLNTKWTEEKHVSFVLVDWKKLMHSIRKERIQDYFNREMLECDTRGYGNFLYGKKQSVFTVLFRLHNYYS